MIDTMHDQHLLLVSISVNPQRTWETSYKPEWKETSILEFATKMSHDQNHMVKKLVRKAWVTRADLKIAIRTVNERFIVGLVNQMEESIHRFNIVMGIDEADEDNRKCMDKFLGEGGEKENSNSHPKVSISVALSWWQYYWNGGSRTQNYFSFSCRSRKIVLPGEPWRRKMRWILYCTIIFSFFSRNKRKLSSLMPSPWLLPSGDSLKNEKKIGLG